MLKFEKIISEKSDVYLEEVHDALKSTKAKKEEYLNNNPDNEEAQAEFNDAKKDLQIFELMVTKKKPTLELADKKNFYEFSNQVNNDKDYLKEYINLKNKNITNFEMDRLLRKAFIVLNKYKDDYKDLQNNKELKDICTNIKESNEKLTATTSYFNKNTNLLNGYIRKFPSNIIAKINKFTIKPFFDGKNMNDEIYNDFKL